MADKNEQKSQPAPHPVLFMGKDYYDVLKLLILKSADSNINNNLETWISVLRQLYNLTHKFMSSTDRDEVKRAIMSCHQDMKILKTGPTSIGNLVLQEKIWIAEEKLYSAINALLVKTSTGDDDSIMPNLDEVWTGK